MCVHVCVSVFRFSHSVPLSLEGGGVAMVKVAVGDRTAAALSSLFSLSVSPSSVVWMKETQGKSSLCLLPPPTTTPPTIPVPPPPVVSEPLPHPHISVFHPMTLAVRQIDTPLPNCLYSLL